MSITWNRLRSWDGSQGKAFEELCCQLAECEEVTSGSRFVRKGTPDAGVECYRTLANEDEWGWQAKFFVTVPGAVQWQQIDNSVKTSLEKHPHLVRYFICLPINRSDPRTPGRLSFMDKWKEHVQTWRSWASDKQMSVEFEYWGEHEIFSRLSLEEHRGRYCFWFQEQSFSQTWFENRIAEAIADAGARYTPELNVELPIARIFEGLGRTPRFFNRMKALRGKLSKEYRSLLRATFLDAGQKAYAPLVERINSLLSLLAKAENPGLDQINVTEIISTISDCRELLKETVEVVKKQKSTSEKSPNINDKPGGDFQYAINHLYEVRHALGNVAEYFASPQFELANVGALLVSGGAGTGKTHLFCDVANQRCAEGLPTVLFLGQHFSTNEPWSQMLQRLGLICSKEELLGALEAAAQIRGGRALILIDGLNEGEGRNLWNNYLAGILTTLRAFPRVGISLSVRSTYEDIVIPRWLGPDKLIKQTHHGFGDQEYQAMKTFFNHYGIEHPTVPPLVPEFQNPMFLKLFCLGLKNRKLTRVPPGLHGINEIFEFFLDSINDKLAQPDFLDFEKNTRPIHRAVGKFSGELADRGTWWLPADETQSLINSVLPREGREKSLYRQLISEGVFSVDRFWSGQGTVYEEGIRFSYDRFTDYSVAKILSDRHLDPLDPLSSFRPDSHLGRYLKDEPTAWMHSGLIEAFSLQIPEKLGKELADIAPHCADFEAVRKAFVQSLIFREPTAITSRTLKYINNHVNAHRDTHEEFLDALLTIASVPEHPYNADFLHRHLMKHSLPDRDSWWSTYLHRQYNKKGAIDRLVDWAWSPEDKSHIEDESIRLAAAALAWFLTTSNRYLRDGTTKALTSLLSTRINVLRQVLKMFQDVNDPYVLERLLAVAYGCAIRCRNKGQLDEMAREVYEMYFQDREPPPAFLLRDYARGVIETALRSGEVPGIDPRKVRPPYRSEWPQRIPDKEELEKYGEWHKEMRDEEFGRVEIYSSVMGMGDFARYIIGTNSGSFDWSSRRLGEPPKPSMEHVLRSFVKSLTKRQRGLWSALVSAQHNLRAFRFSQIAEADQFTRTRSEETRLKKKLKGAERSFCASLGGAKLNTFASLRAMKADGQDHFDLTLAQRWILAKVFDLGWTTERFGKFDRNVNLHQYGRDAKKAERIGKKYQWIAYHEFLALVSDNFEFKGEPWSEKKERFEGAWQIWARDIDPSFLLTKTKGEDWEPDTEAWWLRSSYDAWEVEPDEVKWTESATDLPPVEPLLQVRKPEDHTDWLVMDAFYKWEQPTPIEEDRFDFPRRQIWYMLKSYIVKSDALEEILAWASGQNYMGRWMPESQELHRVFLGEYHWAPAYKYHNRPYYGQHGWTRGNRNKIPAEILPTASRYSWSGMGYDCSLDDSISIYLPCAWIADTMRLLWAGGEGRYCNQDGQLVAFDPSVNELGPPALLMHKERLLEFLDGASCGMFWTLLGEKQVVGGWNYPKESKGRLTINGTFTFQNGSISGSLNTSFDGR